MIFPIGTLNCSGDAVGPAEYLPSPFQTLSTVIAAVTGELLGELRRVASGNEIEVIGAPYGVEKPVGAFARLHISLTHGNELNMKVRSFWPRLEALIDLRVNVLSTLGRASTSYPQAFSAGWCESKNRSRWLQDSGPSDLHVWRSANEQPTGEAERLAGPRAGPLEIPRLKDESHPFLSIVDV